GADDEDGAIGALEGAHPARPGIGVDDERRERMRPVVNRLPVLVLLRAGEPEAGMDAGAVALAEARRRHRRLASIHDFTEGEAAQPGVSRTGAPFAEQAPARIADAGGGPRAAAIDADEKGFLHLACPLAPVPLSIMPLQSQPEKCAGLTRRHRTGPAMTAIIQRRPNSLWTTSM